MKAAAGIRALLEGMQERTGWEPIIEDDHPIGLSDEAGGGAISLEPGGQFELSGAPLRTLHETARETAQHLADAKAVGEQPRHRLSHSRHEPALDRGPRRR